MTLTVGIRSLCDRDGVTDEEAPQAGRQRFEGNGLDAPEHADAAFAERGPEIPLEYVLRNGGPSPESRFVSSFCRRRFPHRE